MAGPFPPPPLNGPAIKWRTFEDFFFSASPLADERTNGTDGRTNGWNINLYNQTSPENLGQKLYIWLRWQFKLPKYQNIGYRINVLSPKFDRFYWRGIIWIIFSYRKCYYFFTPFFSNIVCGENSSEFVELSIKIVWRKKSMEKKNMKQTSCFVLFAGH